MNTKEPIEIHMLSKGLSFPIMLFLYQAEERQRLDYLSKNRENVYFTSYDICVWCQSHGIEYKIAYPLNWMQIFKRPWKIIEYFKLRYRLNTFSHSLPL